MSLCDVIIMVQATDVGVYPTFTLKAIKTHQQMFFAISRNEPDVVKTRMHDDALDVGLSLLLLLLDLVRLQVLGLGIEVVAVVLLRLPLVVLVLEVKDSGSVKKQGNGAAA